MVNDRYRCVIDPRRWSLAEFRPRSLVYVLFVDAAAIVVVGLAVVGAVRWPVRDSELLCAAALLAGAVLHTESMKRIERLRRAATTGAVYLNTDSLWIFAGLMLLPFPLGTALTVMCLLYGKLRTAPHSPPHRIAFSVAAAVLASAATAAVLGIGGVVAAQLPLDTGQVWWTIAAVVLRDIAGIALIVVAIMLQQNGAPVRTLLGTTSEHALEIGFAALGAALAVVVGAAPSLLPLVATVVVVLAYASRLPAFELLLQRDGKTGLLTATYWHELAGRELARARRLGQSVAVLMIDIDRFKRINDQHGHLAGDVALRSVAKAISAGLRHEGVAGRFGGEEFAVFFHDVDEPQLAATAERLRHSVAELAVAGAGADLVSLTVSIGGYRSTDLLEGLSDVLLAADRALFAAKQAGRNRTTFAVAGA